MARRALLLLVVAMLLPAQTSTPHQSFAQSGSGPSGGRVVLVAVDGTTLGDWSALPSFRSILGEGAVALLSTRTSCACSEAVAAREASYRTLATLGGRRLGDLLGVGKIPATPIGDANGMDATDVSAALAVATRAGTIEIEPGNAVPLASAPITTGHDDPNAPGGRRTDFVQVRARVRTALEWARFVVVDLGDTARAERLLSGDPIARRPWVDRALRDADQFIGSLRASLRAPDVLVLASVAPPLARTSGGIHLGAVAATGLGRGLLASETTRRAGLITLADLGATIAGRLGVKQPPEARGRPAVVVARRDAPAAARALERSLILAHRSRTPAVRTWLWPAAVLIGLAFALVVAGRGRRPGVRRLPRHARDLVATGLVAVAVAPAALLAAPVFARTTAGAGWLALLLAAGGALGAHLLLGHERALLAGLIATSVVVITDTLVGGPLALRSAIGPEIASGLQLAGTSDALLGVLVVAPLVATGLALDRVGRRDRVVLAGAAILGLAVIAASWPTLGAHTAAVTAGVIGIATLLVVAGGRTQADAKVVHATVIAAVFATGLIVAAHLLRHPPPAPPGGLGAWLRNFPTVWLTPLVAVAGSAAVLLTRRRALAARAYWGRPYLRATLVVSGGIGAGLLFAGSSGLEATAAMATLAAPAFFLPLLAPD